MDERKDIKSLFLSNIVGVLKAVNLAGQSLDAVPANFNAPFTQAF